MSNWIPKSLNCRLNSKEQLMIGDSDVDIQNTDAVADNSSIQTFNRIASYHKNSTTFLSAVSPVSVQITSNVLTVTCTNSFSPGQKVQFLYTTPATFLDREIVEIQTASATQFTANFVHADYASTVLTDPNVGIIAQSCQNLFSMLAVEDSTAVSTAVGAAATFTPMYVSQEIDSTTAYANTFAYYYPSGPSAAYYSLRHIGAGGNMTNSGAGTNWSMIGVASWVDVATATIDQVIGVNVVVSGGSSKTVGVWIHSGQPLAGDVYGVYEQPDHGQTVTVQKNLLGPIQLGSTDTGVSRSAAGVVAIGNGAPSDRTGTLETGGLGPNVVTATTTYAVIASDYTILANGTFTVTLPTTGIVVGQIFVVKNIGAGTVTVSAAVNIDAATSFNLTVQYTGKVVQWDGTQYWIIGSF